MANGKSFNGLRGVFCIDGLWKIIGINDAAAEILFQDKTGSLTGACFDTITGFDAAGAPPSRELVEKALMLRFGAMVTEYLCCADSGMAVVCFSAESAGLPVEKRITDIYRQNKKLSMISMFAAGVAHDYNNALTAVLGNISLAKFEAEENRELADLLNDAEKASLRIKNMTERLSLYSRGIKLNKSRFDIVKLSESVSDRMLAGFCGKKVFKNARESFEVDADQFLVEMVIESLIENAIEASGSFDGIIELEVTQEDVRQELSFREISLVAGKYMKLSVQDNGAGFDPELAKLFFDPYYTTKDGHDGIGLALAFSILKRHRGYISAENLQKGSRFSIFIPLF